MHTVLNLETNFLCICFSHHSYTSYLFIDSEDSLSDADKDHDIKRTVEQQSQMALLRRQVEKKAEATEKPPCEIKKICWTSRCVACMYHLNCTG